jgi:PAS domain S-box-containing protein
MARVVSRNEELQEKIGRLEAELGRARQSGARLADLERICREAELVKDRMARVIYALQAAINMPELYLDRDWNITGYSGSFLGLFKQVTGYAEGKRPLREFLREGDFDGIGEYFRKVESLKSLPYGKGRKWALRYSGPSGAERIGKDWIIFNNGADEGRWEIVEDRGRWKIVHRAHVADSLDCYLLSSVEYGGAEEDLRVIFRIRTSERPENIRDLSLVLSAASGRDATLPDLIGYTVCCASCGNAETRFQRQGTDLARTPEKLEPGTEYEVTVERCGGRLRRLLRDLDCGRSSPPLEVVDSQAVYDRQNFLGFTTFSGDLEVYDIRIYTRRSRFAIGQFRVDFEVEAGIRLDTAPDRLFRLRLGPAHDFGGIHHTLLFEDITARKRSERKLRESEEYYRSLIEQGYEFILLVGEDGSIRYGSPSIERWLGYEAGRIVGNNFFNFIHPEDRERIFSAFKTLKQTTRGSINAELRVRDRQGRWHFIEGTAKNLLDEPVIAGIVMNGREITERKQAEQAFRESEARYRTLVESMNEALVETDENGCLTFFNDVLCRMTGYTREELQGRRVRDLLDEISAPSFEQEFEQRKQGVDTPYVLDLTKKDGSKLYLHVSPKPMFDEEGIFRGSVAVGRDITERRRVEEALENSRAQMRAVIDGIKSSIIFVNRDLEVILANEAAARVLGLTPVDLIGKKYCDVWCSTSSACEDCLPRKTLMTGISRQATRTLSGRTGRIMDMRVDPISDGEGLMLGAVVISEDITSRKRAEELLRQSEVRYRLLFENAGNPIVLIDYNGVFQMLNNLAASYLGGVPEKFVGKSLSEVIPKHFAQRHLEVVRRVIEEGKIFAVDFQTSLQEKRLWFKAIIQPYGFSSGMNCAQVIVHDITELKKAQRELQRERDSLEARVDERTLALQRSETQLQERLKELTCLYNIRQEFDHSGSLDATLDACAEHIRIALNDPDKKVVQIRLGDNAQSGREADLLPGASIECSLTTGGRRRGRLQVFSTYGRRKYMPFEKDLVKQAGASLSDFIRNRELQEQLVQSEKLAAAGRLAAGVAHEINNPLGAVKNSLYILKKAISPQHKDFHFVELMDGEIDRMAGIIVQLYELYKPSARQLRMIDVSWVVGNVLEMLKSRIQRQKIDVRTRFEDLPRLKLSLDQISQVLYNVILNAVQAMTSGGELAVEGRIGEKYIELSISDTGLGIPEDVMPHIFEPFYTTKGMQRVPGEGMGMGLSVSRSIMQSLGGNITVSTGVGRGAAFTLYFPLSLGSRQDQR